MPPGTEVGLGLLDILLDGDPAPPPLKGTAPNFRPMSVVATEWTKMPFGAEVGLCGPRRLCVRWGRSYPQK